MRVVNESKVVTVMGSAAGVVFLIFFAISASNMHAPALFSVVPVMLGAFLVVKALMTLAGKSPVDDLARARMEFEAGIPPAADKRPAPSSDIGCQYCGRARAATERSCPSCGAA